jgi:Ni,Fe-hydrogenase III large subunit
VLTVAGETVRDVVYRPNEEERDYSSRLQRLEPEQVLDLMTRRRGGSTFAYALALCQALEALLETSPPQRAAYLRCAVAEIERLASHLGALHAVFSLLGQQRRTEVLHALRDQAHRALRLLTEPAELSTLCMPGGMRHDLDDERQSELLTLLNETRRHLFALIDQTIDDPRLLARTVDVGTVARGAAEQFMLRGPLARAAGLEVDTRLDEPYAAYARLDVRRIVQEGGDVHARLVLLLLEAFESIKLADQALQDMPAGPHASTDAFPTAVPAGEARSAVESPRGLLRYRLESDGNRLTDLAVDAPQQIDRLLARTLFVGAVLDNVVLIALSTGPWEDGTAHLAKP